MRVSEDIKKLGEDIISSYKLRIKAVGEIVNETHNMLTDFQKEHKIMTDRLRKNLDVDKVERNKYVTDLLKKFADEQKITVTELKVMADELKKSLGKGETDRLEVFDKMMADVQNQQTDRSEYVADLLKKYVPELLKKFADEQKVITDELKVMAEELKKSLIIGETDRLEVFDEMMDDVHAKQADRNEYVADLLNKFVPELLKKFAAEQKVIADDHLAMSENWKEFNKTISNLKSGKPIVEKKVKVRPVAEAIEEVKPKPEPEKPVEESKPKPKPAKKERPWEKHMPIEDKVLAFINAHPKGVKVGDMEEPLGVARMRLGVIGKKLFEAGKVKKIDKVYFPI